MSTADSGIEVDIVLCFFPRYEVALFYEVCIGCFVAQKREIHECRMHQFLISKDSTWKMTILTLAGLVHCGLKLYDINALNS